MRKLFLALILLFASNAGSVFADNGWVHLINGNIVKGDISKTDTKVIITTPDGRVLSYPLTEVSKISYSEPVSPEVKKDPALADYADFDKGFWFRTTLSGAYTLFMSDKNVPLTEFDLAGGYRFNQYLKVGAGVGFRYYINNHDLRSDRHKWGFPVYATFSGNIINETYRSVVPYYNLDLGGTIRDGFMWRPTFGIRVGQPRSAFLLGLTYTGQTLEYKTGKNRYCSALGLSLGYEF